MGMRTPNRRELKVGRSQKSIGMKKMGTQRTLVMEPAALALPANTLLPHVVFVVRQYKPRCTSYSYTPHRASAKNRALSSSSTLGLSEQGGAG